MYRQSCSLKMITAATFLITMVFDVIPQYAAGQDSLVKAADAGNLQLVKDLVAQHVDIDEQDNDGCSPLFASVRRKHKDVAIYLLSQGAKPDIPIKKDGFTPLMVAAGHGWEDVVEMLISKGANVNARSTTGFTPLGRGAASGNENVVRYLIQHGADINSSGYAALVEAVTAGKKNTVDLLLANNARCNPSELDFQLEGQAANRIGVGVVSSSSSMPLSYGTSTLSSHPSGSVNADPPRRPKAMSPGPPPAPRNSQRRMIVPLQIALMNRQEEITLLLIGKGARIAEGEPARKGDTADPALVLALDKNLFKAANMLVARGADVNGTSWGRPLISYFMANKIQQEGLLDIVKFLCQHHANIEQRAAEEGRTPLMVAASKGHKDVIEMLLSYGAKVNAKYESPRGHGSSDEGATALTFAAGGGHTDIVELLISRGADCTLRNTNGYTGLILAVTRGYDDVARILVVHGADVNAVTIDGKSALEAALTKRNLRIAKLLVDNGADSNAQNVKGFIYLAMDRRDFEMVQFIVDSGLDLNNAYQGNTPLHYAAQRGLDDCVNLFVSKKVNINIKNHEGRTPLMAATEGGHTTTVKILVTKGADINTKDSAGLNAFAIASMKGRSDIADFLASKGADTTVLAKQRELIGLMKARGFISPETPPEQLTPEYLAEVQLSLRMIGISDVRTWHPDSSFSSPESTWEVYKRALIDGDFTLARKCHVPGSRQINTYELLGKDKTKTIILDMGPIQKVSVDTKRAKYRLVREENGQKISYYVLFSNIFGEWKIEQY